jgi:hypothetical protein
LKANWTEADWAGFRCHLLADQRGVMANGRTSFLFLLAPDKSSAYAPWLPAGAWQIDAAPILAKAAGAADAARRYRPARRHRSGNTRCVSPE